MKTYFILIQKVINTKTSNISRIKKHLIWNGISLNYYNNRRQNNKHIYYIYTFMNYIQQTQMMKKIYIN